MFWHKGLIVGLTSIAFAASPVSADWIKLTNKDVVQGKIVSLNEQQLVLQSDNFGEMTIPRDKISLIGLGETPLIEPAPAAPSQQGQRSLSGEMPWLNNPQMNRMLQDILGNGGLQDLQKNIRQSQEGLRDLQKGMDGPSADALDAYIQMFDLFGKIAPQAQPQSRPLPGDGSDKGTKPNTSPPQETTPAENLPNNESSKPE